VKLVHLVGFVTKKFVTMHGHMNVKYVYVLLSQFCYEAWSVNHFTPNGHFSGRTAPLTYMCWFFFLFNRYTYWIF